MAFIVETGSGVVGANSYVTTAFADAYFAIDVNFAATWDDTDAEVKQQRLQWATRILDQKVTWRGTKATDSNPLRWPRAGVFDRDGVVVLSTVIPEQLKQAVCELVKLTTEVDPTTSQGGDALKRLSVDVIEIEYQDDVVQAEAPPILNQILRGLGSYPTSGGHQFARIIKA